MTLEALLQQIVDFYTLNAATYNAKYPDRIGNPLSHEWACKLHAACDRDPIEKVESYTVRVDREWVRGCEPKTEAA